MKFFSLLLLLLIFHSPSFSQTFTSSNSKVQLLELYSSQGCNSCPPAERWISRLKQHPDLWNKFVPVVFHVDYWDYLGWKDPFSNSDYSARQRKYYSQRAVRSVYTPGLLLDGKEWRGWYRNKPFLSEKPAKGTLHASLNNNQLTVSYSLPVSASLNVALLGFELQTDVLSGENQNKTFSEDFIVLSLKTVHSANAKWSIPVDIKSEFKSPRYALAIWINSDGSLEPIQATGGWIKH